NDGTWSRRHEGARRALPRHVARRPAPGRRLPGRRHHPARAGSSMSRERPIRVGVVDDQALVRTGFVMILEVEPDIEVVFDAANGRTAVELVRRHRPDVVLMDIRMPELDGIEATRLITTEHPDGPCILMLTTFDLDEYVYD